MESHGIWKAQKSANPDWSVALEGEGSNNIVLVSPN